MKLSNLLIIIGSSMLLYSSIAYVPQLRIGEYGEGEVKRALAEAKPQQSQAEPIAKSNAISQSSSHAKSQAEYKPLYSKRPETGEYIGELIIPKLEAVLPIIEGTDPDQLEKGVGHYRKSVLPGEPDNVVLSGHRDTVFRNIGSLEVGDKLITKTKAGTFSYKIEKTWITDEDDRTVIVSHKGKKVLTLTTCYPFNYIGSAPKRYIIQAEMSE